MRNKGRERIFNYYYFIFFNMSVYAQDYECKIGAHTNTHTHTFVCTLLITSHSHHLLTLETNKEQKRIGE